MVTVTGWGVVPKNMIVPRRITTKALEKWVAKGLPFLLGFGAYFQGFPLGSFVLEINSSHP